MAVNNFIKLLKNKKYFRVAVISGKLSRNTFVNYKSPKYFTGRQVCLIWEELTMESIRGHHVKSNQEAA